MPEELPPHAFVIDIGDMVLCDYCNADYTESEACGGGIVDSYAVCPQCIRKVYRKGETPDVICPEGMTFKEFVLTLRNGDNSIVIASWEA